MTEVSVKFCFCLNYYLPLQLFRDHFLEQNHFALESRILLSLKVADKRISLILS